MGNNFTTSGTYIDGTINLNSNNFDVALVTNDKELIISSIRHLIKIPLEKIIGCNLKTEQDISHDVTLGRLLIFGIFAFGMKKTKKIITKYIVINYYDESNVRQTIIVECPRFTSIFIDKVRENIDNFKKCVESV